MFRLDPLIQNAAAALAAAERIVALTGAGISVESGIPPFRGKGGLWEKIDPMEYAHIDAFMNDPAKVIEINPERTPLSDRTSDVIIMGKAGEVMKRLVTELESML
jgi:NAD-dependent SIR2 family protein deacetylase